MTKKSLYNVRISIFTTLIMTVLLLVGVFYMPNINIRFEFAFVSICIFTPVMFVIGGLIMNYKNGIEAIKNGLFVMVMNILLAIITTAIILPSLLIVFEYRI